MTKREDVNVDYNSADKASKAAENVMNHMQDVKEGMSDNAKKVAEDTPTTPEEFINKKGFTAWRAAEEVKEKQKAKEDQDTENCCTHCSSFANAKKALRAI